MILILMNLVLMKTATKLMDKNMNNDKKLIDEGIGEFTDYVDKFTEENPNLKDKPITAITKAAKKFLGKFDYTKYDEEQNKQYINDRIDILIDVENFDKKLKLCLEYLPDVYENMDFAPELEDEDVSSEMATLAILTKMHTTIAWVADNWKEYEYVGHVFVETFYLTYISLKPTKRLPNPKQEFLELPFEVIDSIMTEDFLSDIKRKDRTFTLAKDFTKRVEERCIIKYEETYYYKFLEKMNERFSIINNSKIYRDFYDKFKETIDN